jgi:hypothetical protein
MIIDESNIFVPLRVIETNKQREIPLVYNDVAVE